MKTAIRNLLRNKVYAAINIIGLAVGIACCLLISLFVKVEFTYDSFHSNVDSIYRINILGKDGIPEKAIQWTPYVMGDVFGSEIPEIEAYVHVRSEAAVVKNQQDLFDEKGLIYTEANLFKIFDFKLLYGSFDDGLDALESVVLTESAAKKYFGAADIVGQELDVKTRGEFETFVVSAVIADHPTNSSFNFNMALSWSKFKTVIDDWSYNAWFLTPVFTYVKLQNTAVSADVVDKMMEVKSSHLGEDAPGAEIGKAMKLSDSS